MKSFDNEKRESESNWHILVGPPSSPSFDTIGSRVVSQHHNLQILRKKEPPSERRIIPATLHEKLSYYRAFVASPSKTQIMSMQQTLYNKYLWFYIFNVFCKSLPCTYVYVFLSSYAAEDHFFVPKMIPLFYGHMWYSIISAFFAIINFSGYVVLLWDYVISGLIYKNPWNRCTPFYNISMNASCYDVNEFTKKIQNKTLIFQTYGYMHNDSGEIFQMAPLLFLKSRMESYSLSTSNFWMYEMAVFVTASLFYRQLFKKYIWKMLHYSQCALLLMYLATFFHLTSFYFMNGFKKVPEPNDTLVMELWNADVDVLAESMTSPPIVHILSARGTETPRASRDSARIIASNAVYYIFSSLLAYMMKRYCEHVIGCSLFFTELNPCSSFFFWPIYLSYFYLGDYYTIMYFFLNGVEEFLMLAITLSCLIEVMDCEWRWMKPLCIIVFLAIAAFILTFTISGNYLGVLYVYLTGFTTLAETITLFCLYPLGRLVDDITFHCGVPPTTLWIWNFRIVPVFYTVKIFLLLNGFLDILRMLDIVKLSPHIDYMLYIQIVPFILGFFYVVYDIVYLKKESWKQLFIPVPEWGPKDPTLRRLRNQYDSRQYIGSQAPRELSRYFMKKTELTTYQVDIQYDSYPKHRETLNDVLYEEEKKSI